MGSRDAANWRWVFLGRDYLGPVHVSTMTLEVVQGLNCHPSEPNAVQVYNYQALHRIVSAMLKSARLYGEPVAQYRPAEMIDPSIMPRPRTP